MTAALEVRELVAGYGGVPAVHGVSLVVDQGELVTLLGPNGAGKSTTLLTIAGALRPIAGSISVHGEATAGRRAHQIARRGVALVPQDRGIFFQLTVAENLRLRRSRRAGGATLDEVYDHFPQLRERAGQRAGLLSGGEQQMLALGCALLSAPRLLMVDEMSHGLAPVIVGQLMPMLRTIADRTGLSVLFVEQHVAAALDVADRGYVLSRGVVAMDGQAAALRAAPELLEASYLGTATATTR